MSTLAERLPRDRRFEFSSQACADDTFAVVRMSGFEAISRPYRFELVLVSNDAHIDLAAVLGAGAALRILAPDDTQRATPYAGVLAEFDQLHQAGGFTFYRAVLVPRLWQLSLYRSSEVYLHEQSVPDIIEGIFKGASLRPGRDYEFKLRDSYRPRSYVCQYQETPLAFVSRWLEREGICYYFEQAEGRERLLLLDDKVFHPAQAVAVSYRPADELDTGLAPDAVQGFMCRTRALPRTLVLQDYNHRRAGMPLVVQAQVSAAGLGEEMLYGENFRTEEEGRRYAGIRAQELRCAERVFSGEATAVGLRSGHFMDLSHHYRDDFNGRYLVTEITHEGSQAGALLTGLKTPFNEREGRGETAYRNSFVALPAATQFRPARTTPKPRVAGTMNATIDAEGTGEYAELDAYGQYKVQIPFDRTQKGAAKGSAPVRMASPYAGSDHGMHFPLHKGAEVLLSFTDGDPDQPVILGAVPNSVNPNVVDQRNPHDNLISTKGGNQMLMADTKGKEVIWLNSPFHMSSIGIGSVHPKGGGSIYEATKGGSDSVSFGTSNAMSFGSSNSLSLGTSASVSASLSNSVSVGASLAISLGNDIRWNMNLLPWTDAVKSFSIDDSDSVSLQVKGGTNAMESITFTAGASMTSVNGLALEAELKALRGWMSVFTAFNFAQSTVFGMAVNGSADGALTPQSGLDQKKTRDDAAAQSKRVDDRAKQAELDKADADWTATHEASAAKIAALEKKSPRSKSEEVELNGLKDQRETDLADKKASIAKRYDALDAARNAPSAPDNQGFMGWPGIIGKFGTEALANVGGMAYFQSRANKLAEKINALKPASEMAMSEVGIVQTVFDTSTVPTRTQTGQIALSPTTGVSVTALGFEVKSGGAAEISAVTKANLLAPEIVVSADSTKLRAHVWVSDASNEVEIATSATAGSVGKLSLGLGKATLTADTVVVGRQIAMPDPVPAILAAQLVVAKAAVSEAKAAATATWDRYSEAGTTVSKALAWQMVEAADEALQAAIKTRDAIDQKLVSHAPALGPTDLLAGLSVDSTKTALTHTATSVEVSAKGVAMRFGATSFELNAQGLSGTGPLIKLG